MKWFALGCVVALAGIGQGNHQLASARGYSENGRPSPCRPSQFRIAQGTEIVPATGQNPLSIVLTNRSTKECLLDGYPTVSSLDAGGKRLPFRISHRGDQMVTSHRPVAVRVLPRHVVFIVLNKYRCDLGILKLAKRLRIGLPGVEASARLTLRLPRYPILGYCGKNDPGSILTVSPIEPTLAAALAHP